MPNFNFAEAYLLVHEAQDFVPASWVLFEDAAERRCHHCRAGFPDTANGHATMRRFQYNGDAHRL